MWTENMTRKGDYDVQQDIHKSIVDAQKKFQEVRAE